MSSEIIATLCGAVIGFIGTLLVVIFDCYRDKQRYANERKSWALNLKRDIAIKGYGWFVGAIRELDILMIACDPAAGLPLTSIAMVLGKIGEQMNELSSTNLDRLYPIMMVHGFVDKTAWAAESELTGSMYKAIAALVECVRQHDMLLSQGVSNDDACVIAIEEKAKRSLGEVKELSVALKNHYTAISDCIRDSFNAELLCDK